MLLSVVIPCYNERETIATVVAAVRAAAPADKEIIIVDDCSKDGTRELLRTEIEKLIDRVIYREVNNGKGAALRAGYESRAGTSSSSRTRTSNTTRPSILSSSSQSSRTRRT